MVEEVVIRIRKCNDCPFVQYVFTKIGTAVYACGIAKDVGTWNLGGGIPEWCPLREESNVQKNRKRKLVQDKQRGGHNNITT